jgi:hypothetical protein
MKQLLGLCRSFWSLENQSNLIKKHHLENLNVLFRQYTSQWCFIASLLTEVKEEVEEVVTVFETFNLRRVSNSSTYCLLNFLFNFNVLLDFLNNNWDFFSRNFLSSSSIANIIIILIFQI